MESGESFTSTTHTHAEFELLHQKVAALEAIVHGSRLHSKRSSWSSTKLLAVLLLCAALAGVSLVYGQAADALFIDAQGNVGIGSTTPAQKLDVAGTIRSSTGGFQFPDGTVQTTALPAGAVVAFDLPSCPTGWSDYAAAYGRFIRGIDKSGQRTDSDGQRAPGSMQGDAIRNITGSLQGVSGAPNQAWPWGFRPGSAGAFSVALDVRTYNKYAGDYTPPGAVGTTAVFDASKAPGVLTAAENRPKNVALLYCRRN